MKTTLASMLLLLGLVALATVPTAATAADQCPAAMPAPQPSAPDQANQPDKGEGLESDLFHPEPLPLCRAGMCASSAQCPEGAECYIEPGWTCGYCLF